jgi:hypothetical protein
MGSGQGDSLTQSTINPAAAEAGGYVLAVTAVLVSLGLILHPIPASGFEEQASVLSATPLWAPIHVAIALGFVLCVLGCLLVLIGGGPSANDWRGSLCWGAMAVGMLYFQGVALINGFVMHALAPHAQRGQDLALYDAFNRLLVGYGWMGNPLFLIGLTGIAFFEVRRRPVLQPRWLAWTGFAAAMLSWGRGVGSATGLYFLNVLILANVPAFLWLGLYGLRISGLARQAR